MLNPEAGRADPFPKPTRILSKEKLRSAWRSSRDSTRRAGRPGIDNISAEQFSAKLDSNLGHIAKQIALGDFAFSSLRAVFIPKENSDKERMICIPIVRDRIVQRAIAEYLTTRKLFPIYHSSSFGFIKERGTQEALRKVVELRSRYEWCLKTDIEAFFDRVPRNFLKQRVYACLRRHSLTPLIYKAIDCEVRVTPRNSQQLAKQSVKRGVGIRQGMPLSPLLANLALADFDKEIESAGIEMVRYADDLALFFKSKDAAHEGRDIVAALLQRMQLTIPKISDGSKTKVVSSSDTLEFLGREVVYLGNHGGHVVRVGQKQILKIKDRLAKDFSFLERVKERKNFQETIVDLSKSTSAYLGIYNDAFNFQQLESDLRGHGRAIIVDLFQSLFGKEALGSLTLEGRKFLGMGVLDMVEPNPELDV